MQPKTLAARQSAPQFATRLGSIALHIPMFLIAAVVAALLVAKLEAVGYDRYAVPPDPELVFQTMMVSP
jgi:hypothetical protein